MTRCSATNKWNHTTEFVHWFQIILQLRFSLKAILKFKTDVFFFKNETKSSPFLIMQIFLRSCGELHWKKETAASPLSMRVPLTDSWCGAELDGWREKFARGEYTSVVASPTGKQNSYKCELDAKIIWSLVSEVSLKKKRWNRMWSVEFIGKIHEKVNFWLTSGKKLLSFDYDRD